MSPGMVGIIILSRVGARHQLIRFGLELRAKKVGEGKVGIRSRIRYFRTDLRDNERDILYILYIVYCSLAKFNYARI